MNAPERETMEVDVLYVGAGPATLASAYHLMQTCEARGIEAPSVLVIEKGAEVGDHMLSGAVINPRAVRELMPDFVEQGFPTEYVCTKDMTYLFVGTGKHCGPCVGSAPPLAALPAEPTCDDSDSGCAECKACQSGATSKVFDVVDLRAGYQINGEPAPFVSFDEPPLAKRPGEVQRVGFEATADGPEVLPPPREAK